MALEIPALQRNIAIVNDKGFPSAEYQIWWQRVINSLVTQITDIQSALDAAGIAIKSTARTNSYTIPTVTLSAVDAGTNASITIANHTRVYPTADGSIASLSIIGTTLTGLAYSTSYYVYYDDPTLADTTPTFLTTTSAATAQVGAGDSRHFVGVITTPAAGGGGTGGTGGTPPGGGGGVLP